MSPATAEAVETVILTNLNATLTQPTLTDAELTEIADYWSGLNGHLANEARHLIDELFEYRKAEAHKVETEHAALLAAMAPPAKWGCTR